MRFLGCLVLFVAASSMAQFSPKETQMIADTLSVGGYTVDDLQFARQSFVPQFGLDLCNKALASPISGAESIMALHAKADTSTQSMLTTIISDCFKDTNQSFNHVAITGPLKNAALLPEELRQPVADLVSAISTANAQIKDATSKLTPEEKRAIIESLPQWAALGTDIPFEFVSKPKISQESLYALLAKVNLPMIRNAALELDHEVQDALPKIRLAAAAGWKSRAIFSENGVNVEVAGVNDDLHDTRNSHLCIDLGGRNRYTGRYGAGIGYASVVIDLGSDIKSDFPDASAGVGILGIGEAIFEGARPDLIAKNIAFGSGLAGVGVIKVDQAFRMESRSLGQGFGMCGIGLMIGSKGSDTQKIGYLGQGAGMMGGVGWLFNPAGNDRYRAGGLVPDGISRQGFLCRAQGYCGILPGGMGLLTDNDGDDLYEAGAESQASASGCGIASLYDLEGEDAYFVHRKGQAFAEDEGVAMLFDMAGDDVYMVRENQCHAYAVDRSVALVLDRAGNDVVAAHDSEPATAQEGSVAIYLDAEGSDTFAGPVGVGVTVDGRFGVGLFADFGGDNKIASGPGPGAAVYRDHAIAYNGEGGVSDELPSLPRAGSIHASDDEIDDLWEKVQASGKDAFEAGRKLNGIGQPAFERFCTKFAEHSTPRSRRVAASIVSQVPGARKVLADKASIAKDFAERALFEVATLANCPDLRTYIGPALQNEATRRMATRYAAAIGATEFIDPISGLVLAGDALTAQDAVIAIAKLGDAKLVSTMESLMQTKDLVIREQAIQFIAKYPRGLELGKQMMGRSDEHSLMTGIELLGAVGTDEALRLAGSGLNSTYKNVKVKALTTLSGRVPESYRARVIELTKDPNPMVAAVARGVDIGR
ncbi:MAG: hypothetical protein GC165_10690 [Armatimonadetes bacterium]|nr:hypothetical protein [Armatimonadota bacterium]